MKHMYNEIQLNSYLDQVFWRMWPIDAQLALTSAQVGLHYEDTRSVASPHGIEPLLGAVRQCRDEPSPEARDGGPRLPMRTAAASSKWARASRSFAGDGANPVGPTGAMGSYEARLAARRRSRLECGARVGADDAARFGGGKRRRPSTIVSAAFRSRSHRASSRTPGRRRPALREEAACPRTETAAQVRPLTPTRARTVSRRCRPTPAICQMRRRIRASLRPGSGTSRQPASSSNSRQFEAEREVVQRMRQRLRRREASGKHPDLARGQTSPSISRPRSTDSPTPGIPVVRGWNG